MTVARQAVDHCGYGCKATRSYLLIISRETKQVRGGFACARPAWRQGWARPIRTETFFLRFTEFRPLAFEVLHGLEKTRVIIG